jgi:glycosyltransferase involved in cell wall biosynthesis
MKILEICPYSAGACGVWQRVKQESIELAKKGYEVRVFSSYFEKETNKIMPLNEKIGKIQIQRFPSIKLGGESFMYWNFEKEALEYAPDVIIVHNYRHLHTTKALKIKKILEKQEKKCKVFLVTHAPFVEDNITRTKFQTFIVNFYDKFIGPRIINKFDKIIAITRWEIPYLLKLGVNKEKIVHIPNGIPEEFFKQKNIKPKKDILFLGRISPIKDLETLIKAAKLLPEVNFSLIGPAEKEYFSKLKNLVGNSKSIKFYLPVYDLKKKIQLIDNHKIFVLPSRREAMPQVLLEAMARGKIIIASENKGSAEIISDRKNGFLFPISNYEKLAKIIEFCFDKKNKKTLEKIRKNAILKAREFRLKIIFNDFYKLILKYTE